MARKCRTIEPNDRAARQRAIETHRARLDRIREEARREAQVVAALREGKRRHELRENALNRGSHDDTRSTRRFWADLQEIVKLPCGREPDPALLANLARYRRDWQRSLSTWEPQGETHLQQQSSLIRHLLVRYHVPSFMEQAWYMADLSEGREYRTWFLRLTRGENIRSCSPPIRLTHKAAHLFLQAPADCTIVGAMRRAQYLAMGGSVRGSAELLNTALGYAQPNESFWESALLYLANHEAELRAGQVALVSEYLHWRANGGRRANPVETEPVFTIKGRSLANLLREAEAYRAARPALSGPATWWDRTGIGEWTPSCDHSGREWSIVELLSSAELRHEGDVMRHCVGHYDRHCLSGYTSIWSVRCKAGDSPFEEPIMTLEMRNERREIVQARGKCNQSAMDEKATPVLRFAARIVIEWAEREKVSINWGLLGWNRGKLFSSEEAAN